MKLADVLSEIYTRSRSDERTALQHFLDLERNHGMTGVTRAKFEEYWEIAKKYPCKVKLDIITERQQATKKELLEAMLACDPPWDDVLEWAKLIKEAQETPHGLPLALEGLAEYNPALAVELRTRCESEFPAQFPKKDGTDE